MPTCIVPYISPVLATKPHANLPTFEEQGDAVRQEKSNHTPKTPKRLIVLKQKSFKNTSLIIITIKVFGFMYYQCYKAKRNTYGKSGVFNRAKYDAV